MGWVLHRIIFQEYSSRLSGSMEKTNIQAQAWDYQSCKPECNEWVEIWEWSPNWAKGAIFGWSCLREMAHEDDVRISPGTLFVCFLLPSQGDHGSFGKGIALESAGERRKSC